MRTLVIIPTYNEKDNIASMIEKVLAIDPGLEILVVDDNSPDGTAQIVKTIATDNSRVHILVRAGKLGLGTAYVEGFKQAVNMGVDNVVQMDADFSHNPKYLSEMLAKIKDADVIIGSRYIGNRISVVNWPLARLMLSYFANIYARWVIGSKVYDVTGGFKMIRRDVLEKIKLDKITSNGYAFQVELNYIFKKKGCKVIEIPIIFTDREDGVSKMSKAIILEAVFRIWLYRFKKY